MSLRNQPYLPLYIQDYLTDEKLNNCSWETQGIYIKILCVLHKMNPYGAILFKQKDKQNSSICLTVCLEVCFDFVSDFASILLRQIPCEREIMENALKELLSNEVLLYDGEKLYQKRMLKDGHISIERSKAAKKGGGNPLLFKQNSKQTPKQKDKQIPEYENEYNIEPNDLVISRGGVGGTEKFLADEMVKTFFAKNPTDLPNDLDDKKNCWSIAQKIEKAKGWELQSSLNGKMEDCLNEWKKILDFVGADEFFKKFSLKNIDSQFSAIWKNYSQKSTAKIEGENKSIRGVEFLENFTKVRLSDGGIQELGRDQSEMAKFNEILPKHIWKGKPKS
jgi:hypothetical protein